MRVYGVFEWIFWVAGFLTLFLTLSRIEVFSTVNAQRAHRHGGQQLILWILTATFMLAGFVTAILAMRAGAS
ncbi:hypothetical protein ACQCSX_15815 [Pseudarthrobacter sp. P1]|uniref:hypothetical protein n=1 Tax=Pseudarthrobacter sp. P1 TaxID=3418418 RepID=UPI003CEECC47